MFRLFNFKRMNKLFIPSDSEELLVEQILQVYRAEFGLIRITKTMLDKSIIDANEKLREILKNDDIIDFDQIQKNQKEFRNSILISDSIIELKTSFYRPTTKNGDPRFWLYGLNKYVSVNDLLFITTLDKKLVIIKLKDSEKFVENLLGCFGSNPDELLIRELIDKLKVVSAKGWIKSISPLTSNPRDVGATLEASLGIPMNSLKSADYKGKIEIKSKRKESNTNDSLFSKVPDWQISRTKSAADMILKYGYVSKVHEGFYDLYVTVSNTPNNQGLYNLADDNTLLLNQCFKGILGSYDVCTWKYQELQQAFEEKHPKTAWIVAEEKKIDGEIFFNYISLVLTQQPIFSQFVSLINQGIITFDWRGKVKPDKTGYRDHGHGFRINPSNRSKLFGLTVEHNIVP